MGMGWDGGVADGGIGRRGMSVGLMGMRVGRLRGWRWRFAVRRVVGG